MFCYRGGNDVVREGRVESAKTRWDEILVKKTDFR
jgi:hypothetical protein